MSTDKHSSIVEKFHKATILLAEKLVGESTEGFLTFPFVARLEDGKYALFVPGTDPKKADYDYLHPFIVNAGLTLELKLKHLHAIENKKTPRGHNLLALFNELSEDTKSFLQTHVEGQTKESSAHAAITDAARQHFKATVSWEAQSLLAQSSNAFERWRYLHEEKNQGSWFCGYIEIYRALEDRITKAKNEK